MSDTVETLKESAANFGFDGGTVADILEKHGSDVLALMIEAARNGFNAAWILDTFNKLGPAVLQFLTDLFNKNMSVAPMGMAAVGDSGIVVGEGTVIDANVGKLFDGQLLEQIIQKMLPQLIEKYGPQLIQMLIDAIIKAVTGVEPDKKFAEPLKLDPNVWQSIIKALMPAIQNLLLSLIQKYGPQLVQALIDAITKALTPKSPEPMPVPTPAPAPVDPNVHPGVVL
jgi:hypothetical protein